MKLLHLQPIIEGSEYPDAILSVCKCVSPLNEDVVILRIPMPFQISRQLFYKDSWASGWAELFCLFVKYKSDDRKTIYEARSWLNIRKKKRVAISRIRKIVEG